MLPSYTQLGMAALLPNKALAIADNETGIVLVDGQSSQGRLIAPRYLAAALNGQRAGVCKAEDFMQL
jgi:hypothetical protein